MSKTGPIIFVDDDPEECELITIAYDAIGIPNKMLCLGNGNEVIEYLEGKGAMPFLIFSDIHMPMMDGLQLRQRLVNEPALNCKYVPFIFLSTTASPTDVAEAYALGAHGVFEKGSTVGEIQNTLASIIGYWNESKHPE
jgi:CheY-like chemotaxis protein